MRNSYHAIRSSAVVDHGWVKGDMIKAGEFDKIKDMTAEAVALVKKIRG